MFGWAGETEKVGGTMRKPAGQQAEKIETTHQYMLRTMKAELAALDAVKFSHAAYLLKTDIKRVQELVDFPDEVTA
jgi:hypothetical protein